MAAVALKAGAFASLCAILIALYVRKHLDEVLKDRLVSVLQGLVEVEQQHSIDTPRRVAVGYGGCHDLFVNAEDLLEFQDAARNPEHFSHIKTYDELLKTYAYFFRHGAAAEDTRPSNGGCLNEASGNPVKRMLRISGGCVT
ncbi:ADP-dependent glucokinase [Gryllus bimaculatus]|nr:ADP-dependent glucokinase [Gryllus bimaculatus]